MDDPTFAPPTREEAIGWCERLDVAWQSRTAGAGPPRWQDYLPRPGQTCDPDQVFFLIQTDIEHRIKSGLPALLGEDYFRHPRLSQADALLDDARQVELIRWEYQQRWKNGDRARVDEYRAAFPQHAEALCDLRPRWACPRCRRSSVLEETAEVLNCPGCAAAFALSEVFPPRSADATWVGPPGRLAPPARIPGYEVLEELGRGGMGVVYKARQTGLDRVVALKMILHSGHAGREALERFRTEAEAIARLQHPNIVQIHEVGESDGLPFFCMEFCPGGSLDRKLRGVPLPPADAAALVETLARAMAVAHQAGVIHRDLKPANILLRRKSEIPNPKSETKTDSPASVSDFGFRVSDFDPKVTDFGLAKKVDDADQTASGTVLGTPSYMAPEQASGMARQATPLVDVYALGAILYECLTGRSPFRAATAVDTLQQVVGVEPVSPRQLQPAVPRDLETVCLKCLRKEPARRYGSAIELADDLGRFRRGEPVRARPVGWAERAWRWGRRNPKDAALLASGLLAVVVGLVAYLWISSSRQAAEQDRRERLAQSTTQAERHLAEAELLWEQAKTAAVGDLLPWQQALSAAQRASDVIDTNAVEKPTRQRVEQTLAALTAAKTQAEERAAVAARDERMKAELKKLQVNQLPLATVHGQGFVAWGGGSFLDGDYRRAFAEYGIDPNSPDEAEATIRASAIRQQLLDALDVWIPLRPDERTRRQVQELANRLSGPDAFRRELRQALVAKDLPRLRQLARQNPSGFPSSSEIFKLALACSNGGAFAEAVELLRPAQQLYPADHAINFHLAYCLEMMQPPRHDEAIRFYTAAVALRPDNSMYHNSLGNVLWLRGRQDEAVVEYRTANRLDPKNAHALTNLGNALFQQGKLDEAVTAYRAVLQMDTASSAARAITQNNLGVALGEQGKLEEACDAYRAATRLDPRYANAHFGLGWALLERGQFREAADAFKRAREILAPGDLRINSWERARQRAERLRLVAGDLDAILAGRKQPVDGQGIEFAQVCLYRQHPAAAARLFRQAFTAAAALVDRNRFEAALAAALAGAGKGKDATGATEQQRADWRAQALQWLRADLQAWTKKADSGTVEERQAAARQLRVWQNHAAFIPFRDEAERRKWPEGERTAWSRFWADVAAVIDRAETR